MRNTVIIVSLSLALGLVSATDYCKKSCGSTKNLGCDNSGVSPPSIGRRI